MSIGVKRVVIETIPHKQQRYDTVGDWLYDPNTGEVTIYTSDLGDWRMSMACALHELVETMLCVRDGVDEAKVSRFDVLFEAIRSGDERAANAARAQINREFKCNCYPGPDRPTEDDEPGEDLHAPYRKQHAFADGIERLFANAAGLPWYEYAEVVCSQDWYAGRE